MFTISRKPSSSCATPLKPIAGIVTAALLVAWTAGVGAQSTQQPALAPLPPTEQGDTPQNSAPPSAQASVTPQQQAKGIFPRFRSAMMIYAKSRIS